MNYKFQQKIKKAFGEEVYPIYSITIALVHLGVPVPGGDYSGITIPAERIKEYALAHNLIINPHERGIKGKKYHFISKSNIEKIIKGLNLSVKTEDIINKLENLDNHKS